MAGGVSKGVIKEKTGRPPRPRRPDRLRFQGLRPAQAAGFGDRLRDSGVGQPDREQGIAHKRLGGKGQGVGDSVSILSDFRILEFNEADAPEVLLLAVSFAAKIVADLGAEVVKVEPPLGERIRRLRVLPDEETDFDPGVLFEFLNTSKKSVVLDLERPGETDRLRRLAEKADVIITGGDRFDDLVRNDDKGGPRSVVKVRPFPPDSEYRDSPAAEISILALSGLMDLIGDPKREPLMLGGRQASFSSGYAAFTGLMAALASHLWQGRGDLITLDMLSVMAWVNWKAVAGSKFGLNLTREGSLAEWPVVPCRDGYVALVYGFDKDFINMVEVVDDERLAGPKFADFQSRADNRQEYVDILTEWSRHRTKQEIYEAMQGRRVPCGPILTPRDLIDDPQYEEADFIARVPVGSGRTLPMPKVPMQLDGQGFSPTAAPDLDSAGEEFS